MTVQSGIVEKIGKGIVVTATLLLLTGCGGSDGLKRMAIYGQVQGAVGRQGSLTLVPQSGVDAPAATVAIVDGAYRFDGENGPVPGEYEAIVALDGASDAPVDEGATEAAPGEKVVEIKKRGGRTFATFDNPIVEKRVPLTVPKSKPLEVNIDIQ